MLKYFLFLISLSLLLLFFACEEKKGIIDIEDVSYSINSVSLPSRINISRLKTYSLSYKITHPQGLNAVKEVQAALLNVTQDTLLKLTLYDDGSQVNPDGKDVLAFDGIYANTFQSDSMIIPEGEVTISAWVKDGSDDVIFAEPENTLAAFNAVPVLVMASAPDTLPSGSAPLLFSATVQDSDGVEDISSVIMRLKQQGNLIYIANLLLLSSSGLDTATFGEFFDSTFAAERIGEYTLEFQAQDLSGDLSSTAVNHIYLENEPPRLFNISLRDTIKRPLLGQDTLHVKVSADDSQGLTDISSVEFIVTLIGGNTSSPNPMFDDGDSEKNGDDIAGDGRYSLILGITPQNIPGKYVFDFYTNDKAGNISDTSSQILEVLP
jgi:hypothetical protein